MVKFLLKFDVNLQKISTVPQFSKYDRRPPTFKIWQTTVSSLSLRSWKDFQILKKRFCRLDWTLLYGNFIDSCIRRSFDLPRLGSPRLSSRLLSNLSNKVILGRHLPPFLSPLQWHNAENVYGFVFTCGHFVFFVFKVYLDQVKNLIIIFFCRSQCIVCSFPFWHM